MSVLVNPATVQTDEELPRSSEKLLCFDDERVDDAGNIHIHIANLALRCPADVVVVDKCDDKVHNLVPQRGVLYYNPHRRRSGPLSYHTQLVQAPGSFCYEKRNEVFGVAG